MWLRIGVAAVFAAAAMTFLGSIFRGFLGSSSSLVSAQPTVQQRQPAAGEPGALGRPAPSQSGTAASPRTAPPAGAWVGIDEQLRNGTLGRPVYPYALGPAPGFPYYSRGLLLYLASAVVAGWLLWHAAPQLPSYLSRVGFVAVLGIFAGLLATVRDPLWMQHSWGYHVALALNDCFTALVMGLVLAALIRPARSPPPIPAAHQP
jgi:hypothetical protein